jgi:carbamoyl-phosphate synthase large subunit
MNIQFAVQNDQVYILEANPRASRTVPFVSKAIGAPLAKIASRVMAGQTLAELNFTHELIPDHIAVKEAVLPFDRFVGTDVILGPEMRSTGECMGIDKDFGRAYAKSQLAASQRLPNQGTVFLSINDREKEAIVPVVKEFLELGFKVVATMGTRRFLWEQGITVDLMLKVHEGRPHILDAIKNQQIQLIINTPIGKAAQVDDRSIRRTAISYKIPTVTTVAGARATVAALRALKEHTLEVAPLQDYHSV